MEDLRSTDYKTEDQDFEDLRTKDYQKNVTKYQNNSVYRFKMVTDKKTNKIQLKLKNILNVIFSENI